MAKALILYDGVCHLCNGFVRFIINRDKEKKFQFGHLQSPEGQRYVREYPQLLEQMKTVVLVEHETIYTRSTAALRITKHLGGIWSLTYGLIIVPAFVRDAVYDLVSRHRYRLFGRTDQCLVPSPDIRDRFID